jgi:hypothetical protein
MLCLLPLLAAGDRRWIKGVPVPWGPMARTWLALFGAAYAASFLSYDSVRSFAVIDFITACIVLTTPKGEAQRLIGFLAGGMVFVHAGFYSSYAGRLQPGPEGFLGYVQLQRSLGWVQLAALLAGGSYEAYRHSVDWWDARRSVIHLRMGGA